MRKLLIVFTLFCIFNCAKVSMVKRSQKEVQEIYDNAMKAYTNQEYKRAGDLFVTVVKESKVKELKANSFFYLGEINKATENYSNALVSYAAASHYGINTSRDITELASLADKSAIKKAINYAPGDLKPFLLYTLARKYQSIGKNKESSKIFSEIIQKYPESVYARKAKYMGKHKGKTRVGVLLPSSGIYSEVAQSVKNGIEIGSRGEFIPLYVDTRGNPVKSYKEAVDLIKMKEVSGIIGPLFSRNSFAVSCLCDYTKIPFISPTATKEFVDSVGNQSYIINRTIRQQAIAIAHYSIFELGLKSFSILYPNSDYGETFERVFGKKVKEFGGTIINSISYQEGKKDFQEELNRIKKGAPDGVFIPATTTDVPAIASQIKFCSVKSQILGADGWKSEEIFNQQVEKSALEGAIITDNPFHPTEEFLDEFEYVFNKEPTRYASLGFDAARLMGELVKHSKQLKNVQLTAGSLGQKNSYKVVPIYIINKGKFKSIK